MKNLAEKGLIWILKDMNDISEIEEIAIDYYLNKYKDNQTYDNLDETFYLQPTAEQSTMSSFKKVPSRKRQK